MTVQVAAVQCSSDLGAVDANRRKLTKLCEDRIRGDRDGWRTSGEIALWYRGAGGCDVGGRPRGRRYRWWSDPLV